MHLFLFNYLLSNILVEDKTEKKFENLVNFITWNLKYAFFMSQPCINQIYIT